MPDMDDLAPWYALNQQMTNYWADVAGRSSFICPRRSSRSATTGSKERKKSGLSMLGGESTAPPPRVTWSAISGYSGTMRVVYGHSG
jgi:hypothetical protein